MTGFSKQNNFQESNQAAFIYFNTPSPHIDRPFWTPADKRMDLQSIRYCGRLDLAAHLRGLFIFQTICPASANDVAAWHQVLNKLWTKAIHSTLWLRWKVYSTIKKKKKRWYFPSHAGKRSLGIFMCSFNFPIGGYKNMQMTPSRDQKGLFKCILAWEQLTKKCMRWEKCDGGRIHALLEKTLRSASKFYFIFFIQHLCRYGRSIITNNNCC